jgi:hypothetical protein
MVDKERIYGLLRQVTRQLEYMKPDIFREHVAKKQFRFRNYWSEQVINITIDIEDNPHAKKTEEKS